MEQENQNKPEHTSKFVSFFNSVSDIIEKNSIIKILRTLFWMIVFCLVGYFIFNIDAFSERFFSKFDQHEEKQHMESVERRLNNTVVVNNMIDDLREEVGARRCIIIEYHNGRQNLSSLSFNYGNITYESLADSVTSLSEEFQEFSIDRFRFIPYMIRHKNWNGTLDQLSGIDAPFSHKIAVGGSDRIYAASLFGKGYQIGIIYLGFYPGDEIDDTKTKRLLGEYAAQISPYLIY